MAYDRRKSNRKSGRHGRGRKVGHHSPVTRRPISTAEKCKDYCRKFVAFLFSHIGICAIVVAYMIGGAFLFQRLEGEAEDEINSIVGSMIADSVDTMWSITNEVNILNKSAWDQRISNETTVYAVKLIKQIQSGYDNKPRKGKWEFPGAFLFCLTVITTIGYGHIAPITKEGRAATIVYAIFGIPLMLLYLANIGGTLAKSFRYVYGKFQSCVSMKTKYSAQSRSRSKRKAQSTLRRSTTATGKSSIEMSPVTPIPGVSGNFGGPSTSSYGGVFTMLASSLPSSPISKVNRNIPFYDTSSRHDTPEQSGYRLGKSLTEPSIGGDREPSVRLRDDLIDTRRLTTDRVHVPISLCLFILIAYVSIGGILFSGWESWEVHDGVYFCFITLSTIGFGDLVPGEKSLKSENMILCALYILIGLALIAMCFNLMQEGVIHKVKTLGKIIGIIKDPEDDEDDDWDNESDAQ